ncbi:transposase [Martelella lutilitoris]|uniref:Transposase n=1 Tax=Martelella lutilitoris TaxID=2583532 RepID=A0A5C4JU09_9HYPH|nr:transposase [Martelella lutilitoris]
MSRCVSDMDMKNVFGQIKANGGWFHRKAPFAIWDHYTVPSRSGAVFPINGRLRDECLNAHLFRSYRHAREIIADWRIDYNRHRPHTSLDGLTPNEFATRSAMDRNVNRPNL